LKTDGVLDEKDFSHMRWTNIK